MSRSGPPDVMPVLSSFGWTWYDNGAVVRATVDGVEQQIWVPLRYIWALFHQEMQAAGCPLAQEVGAPFTSVGFFKSISRAVKRGYRKAKRAVRGVSRSAKRAARRAGRAVKRTGRWARRRFRKIVPARLRRAAGRVTRFARNLARRAVKAVTSREAQMIVAGLGIAIPALAPAASAVWSARQSLRQVEQGVKAAQDVVKGVKATRGMVQAIQRAARTKAQLARTAQAAKRGDRNAQQIVGALAQLAR